jgi:hypothetical protein
MAAIYLKASSVFVGGNKFNRFNSMIQLAQEWGCQSRSCLIQFQEEFPYFFRSVSGLAIAILCAVNLPIQIPPKSIVQSL